MKGVRGVSSSRAPARRPAHRDSGILVSFRRWTRSCLLSPAGAWLVLHDLLCDTFEVSGVAVAAKQAHPLAAASQFGGKPLIVLYRRALPAPPFGLVGALACAGGGFIGLRVHLELGDGELVAHEGGRCARLGQWRGLGARGAAACLRAP